MKNRFRTGAAALAMALAATPVLAEPYPRVSTAVGSVIARKAGEEVRFDFRAKGGQRRVQSIRDRQLARLVGSLLRRRGGGRELLAYRDGNGWRDVRSEDINAYLKDHADEEISAKDFRTWHATVLTAALLASEEEGLTSITSRKRVVSSVVMADAQWAVNQFVIPRIFTDPEDAQWASLAFVIQDGEHFFETQERSK